MKERIEDTPPPSPGFGDNEDDEMFEDEVDEEIDVIEGEAEGDNDEDIDEEELVELPGGIDQLETLMEEYENSGEVTDDSKLVFSKHQGSVFKVSLNLDEGLVASGGEDDKGYVWNMRDGEVVFSMEEWSDSVTEMLWNKDCSMLAASDMAGNIRVWKYPGFKLAWSFELGQDVLWLQWHPQASVLLAGTAEGQIWVWRIPRGDSKVMGSGERVECGQILADGKRCAAGYSDGTIRIWDLQSCEQTHSLTGVHKDAVVNLTLSSTNLLLSGSSDGTVGLWSCSNGKNVGVLVCGEDEQQGVECVAVQDNNVYTGNLAGVVALWDLSTQVSKWSCVVGGAVTQLLVTGDLVYCGTEEGMVRCVDSRTGAAVREYSGHKGAILEMVVKDGVMVTASDDSSARVWDVS